MGESPQVGAVVNRNCPVCGSSVFEVCLVKGALRVVRCNTCGMRFANPVASSFATGAFYGGLAEPFYLSPAKLEGDFASVRFERELRVFRKYCRAGAVLDVGCSTGGFLRQLQSRFAGVYSVQGMDVAGGALEYAAGVGVPVIRGSFLEHDFRGARFEAVTFWAVLEHVLEPGRFVERAASVLAPGGHCFVLVPNWGSLAVRCLGARYRYVMEEHLNYFNEGSLRRLVGCRPDWEEVEVTTSHFNPVVIWQDWIGGKGLERVPDSERAQLLQRTNRWKQAPWLVPLRLIYRMTETALTRAGLADNLVVVLRRR